MAEWRVSQLVDYSATLKVDWMVAHLDAHLDCLKVAGMDCLSAVRLAGEMVD